MSRFFSARSNEFLNEVHPDLAKVARKAVHTSAVDFAVISGVRTREEQFALWRTCHNLDGTPNGAPWKTDKNGTPVGQLTPEGAHGTGESNHQGGRAIDVMALIANRPNWEEKHYHLIADAMLEAAARLNIPLIWGGAWPKKDLVHFELNKSFYK